MNYGVKDIKEITKVSRRTLHYYDEIGLLKPNFTTESGYRIYNDKDLEKLQQILFFRELNFSLKDIKEILESENFNRKDALENQRELLLKEKKRIECIIDTLNRTLRGIEGESIMNKNEMFNGFDISEIEAHKRKYEKEVKEKYGNSNAYKESILKTSRYTKDNWSSVYGGMEDIFKAIGENMDKGADSLEVQELVDKWRSFISNNFYNCTVDIFRGLGEMYVQDERFTKNIDKINDGLSKFLNEAIEIYCNNLK